MQLCDPVMHSFRLMGNFNKGPGEARINSIDFHRLEDLLVTASEDDSINVYDTSRGSLVKTLHSKKYGVANIKFTHSHHAVLYASSKGNDHALRYLSLHDNRFLRYFPGHTDRVTTLAFSPKNDLFMSAGLDRQVRLWDLRAAQSQALLEAPGLPCGSFDEQGMIFCVSGESGILKLYDLKSYDKGPFDTFVVEDERNKPTSFSHIKFTNDGKLMLAVCEGKIYLVDAFDGVVKHRLQTGLPEGSPAIEACFSTDGQYVLSGGEDRQGQPGVRVWSTVSGQEVAFWQSNGVLPSSVKWSPRRCMVASAAFGLSFFAPDFQLLQKQGPQIMQGLQPTQAGLIQQLEHHHRQMQVQSSVPVVQQYQVQQQHPQQYPQQQQLPPQQQLPQLPQQHLVQR